MTTERFRQVIKRFHPDANGGVLIHGAGGALASAFRQRNLQRGRFPRCRCGTVISRTSRRCRLCDVKLRRNKLALVASFVFFAFFAVKSAAQFPHPTAAPNTNPPALYPMVLAWQYANPAPPVTVIQASTNGAGYVFTTNRSSVSGTNRSSIALPAGKWTITVWGTDGQAVSSSASITATRTNYVVVNETTSTDLQRWTTNRLTYAGPPRALKEFWSHSITPVEKWRGD